MSATDLMNGKRNSAFSEEEDISGPPVPKRTVSVNRGIISKAEPDDSSNTSALPDSPKPPPIPKKKTPLKVTMTVNHLCIYDLYLYTTGIT